jgi:hypothetical protein
MTRQDSIRVIGLERHLESTRSVHNDRGYAELVKYIKTFEDMGEPLPIMKGARSFNVSRTTFEKWLSIYADESRGK